MNVSEKNKVAGGLAGALALAAGSHAYAVSSIAPPTDIGPVAPGTTGGPVSWDPDGNAANDFTFNYRHPNSTGTFGVVWQGNMNPVTSLTNAVLGFRGAFIQYAQNLVLGSNIGTQPTTTGTGQPGIGFRQDAQVVLGSIYRSYGVPTPYGGFSPGAAIPAGAGGPSNATGYVGFRLGPAGAGARFGWLQLTTGPGGVGIDFIAAALGAPGEVVQAGVVPEPTSLAALAIGAVAFLRRTARRDA